MSFSAYALALGNHPDALSTDVARLIALSYQPYGQAFLDSDGRLVQPMTQGVLDYSTVTSASAAVANGATVAVHNSAGGDSHNATAEVAASTLTDVKFAATIAMVDNADTVVVKNSAGTTITGTHSAEVALGVLTDVKLASTVAGVVSGSTLTGVTPSGVYATTITFTVAAGVITAVVLS